MRGQKISAILEPSTHVTIGACEHTVVLIMRPASVYSVYIHSTSSCRYCVSAMRNCMLKKENSFTAFHQVLRNATMMNSNFSKRNSAMMRTTRTKYAACPPAAPDTISILFFGRQCNRILHFLRIADTVLTLLFAWMDWLVGLLGVRHKFVS